MIDTIRDALPVLQALGERSNDGFWDMASSYGEPGYSGASLVVLGYYWCRCDGDLHDIFSHYPHLAERFRDLGIEFQWSDEWQEIDDKAYRTTGDSYSWQPSAILTDDCEWVTIDDDYSEILAWAADNPSRCVPANFMTATDLQAAGFTQYEYDGQPPYESGWHPGQTDDPSAILDAIRDAHGDSVEVVFYLDENSQFYSRWTAWLREVSDS